MSILHRDIKAENGEQCRMPQAAVIAECGAYFYSPSRHANECQAGRLWSRY
jgi:hypothetical protein